MPVRFTCPGCRSVLNAADHKVGKTARCPSCGAAILVPQESEPAPPRAPRSNRDGSNSSFGSNASGAAVATSATAMLAAKSAAPPTPSIAQPSFTDSVQIVSRPNSSSAVAVPRPTVAPIQPTPTPASAAHDRSPTTAIQQPPQGIYLSRSMLFVHGAMISLVAAGAFAIGHWIGGGPIRDDAAKSASSTLAGTVIEGTIKYWTPRGPEPDVGALVMILPTGGRIDDAARSDGAAFAPTGGSAISTTAKELLEASGGIAFSTDNAGAFRQAIPVAGDYDILIVSAQLPRTDDAPGLTDFDRAVLSRFVNNPQAIVGRQSFRRTTMSLRSGTKIEHEFRQ